MQLYFILTMFCGLAVAQQEGRESDISITFDSQFPRMLSLEWVGPDGGVPMGMIEPFEKMPMTSSEGHSFTVTDIETGRILTRTVRPHGGTYFVLSPADKDETPIRVKCTLKSKPTDSPSSGPKEVNIDVFPEWSPRGASRFLELVRVKFFDGVALTRVVPKFLTQFGIGADPATRAKWRVADFPDDEPSPKAPPFAPGMMSYAGSGPNSRSTEMFFVMPNCPAHQLRAFGNNAWETPFAKVADATSLSLVGDFFSYGDMPPWGTGADPQKIHSEGYDYLSRDFPNLDYFSKCEVIDMANEDEFDEEL